MLLIRALAMLAVVATQAWTTGAWAQREVTVFAAASLTNALQEICDGFAASSGIKVKLSFAASSILAKQIESGAGAQIFISADEDWMNYLDKAKLIDTASRKSLVGNRLALVVPADQPLRLEIGPNRSWLTRLPTGHIATGDPAHVPVGRYAEQALKRLSAWDEVAPRLARADNVRNALVLVERGEAVAGIVYSTDAAASKRVSVAGLFPESAHDAITYPIALIRGTQPAEARDLLAYLAGPESKATYAKYGFSVRQ